MARQFLTGLNLNQNELLNARIQNLESDPTPAVAGQIYYNTATSVLKYYNGTSWLILAQGGSVDEAITAAINLLTTADIEEDPSATTTSGTMYFTDQRAKDSAAALLTGATKTNITITGDGDGLTITAENGVEDSTTDDLDEGTTNKYFTDTRARNAISDGDGISYSSSTGVISADLGTGLNIDGSGKIAVDRTTVDTWYDASGAAATVQGNLDDHTEASSGVHGLGAGVNVVGDTKAQTLTNKVLGSGTSLSDDIDAENNTITNLAAPSDDSDAATKGYVDTEIGDHSDLTTGVAATTGNVNLGSGVAAVDGVTLVAGSRVLVRAQTNAAQNGIYVSNGTTLSRAADYDNAGETQVGDFVFVDGGSTYGATGWVQTEAVTTLGTDPILWVQFSGAGTFTAGDGLTLDGTEFNVVGTADRITVAADSVDIASTYVGQTSITTLGTIATGTWNADTIALNKGGTGATTAAGARANLGATTKYTAANPELISASGAITWVVTHNMGIQTVLVQVYTLDDFEEVEVDVERTNTNEVTLRWVSATDVAEDSYQVVIIG